VFPAGPPASVALYTVVDCSGDQMLAISIVGAAITGKAGAHAVPVRQLN
jgi:hypothetical protein